MSAAGTQIVQPNFTTTLANASRSVSNTAQKVLICAEMVAASSAVDKALNENLPSTGSPENALFGIRSMAASMVRAFRRINPLVQLDVIGVDEVSGAAATWRITFVGNATAAGSYKVIFGDEKRHVATVTVSSGDTITIIAAAVSAAINLDTKAPVTASPSAGVVTLTAASHGVEPGLYPIGCIGTVQGTVQTVTQTATGTGSVTTTAVLGNVAANTRYQAIVWPWGASAATTVISLLDTRFNVNNAILDGIGIIPFTGTYANAITNSAAFNSQSAIYWADKLETSQADMYGPAQMVPGVVKAAQLAAVRSLRLTEDAAISLYVLTNASLDQLGGSALASLPLFNTPMPDLPVVASNRGFTEIEIEALHDSGAMVAGSNPAGTEAVLGEVVTTYKTDSGGNDDLTWKYVNYVDTSSQCREYMTNNLRSRFGQARLTLGAITRGRSMANAVVIRAFVEKLYLELAGAGFVLVQDGATAIQFFKDNLTVVLDLALGKVTMTMKLPIVTQLRTVVSTINVEFSTEG